MDIIRRAQGQNQTGFTLLELLVTCAILVIMFGLLAIIFGRVSTVRQAIVNSGNAENLAVYLTNTILYGPTVDEVGYGLMNAKADGIISVNDTTTVDSEVIFKVLDATGTEREVKFDFTPASPVPSNTLTGKWDVIDTGAEKDLRPSWAQEKGLEIYYDIGSGSPYTSGFWCYQKDRSTLATSASDIAWVAIRVTVKSQGQAPENGVSVWRWVWLKNQQKALF
ncbi:MAG: type II secretion system protein [Candidatus Omnitrophota bacterium]